MVIFYVSRIRKVVIFLQLLIGFLIISSCKKAEILPVPNVPPDYTRTEVDPLGLYTITEVGDKTLDTIALNDMNGYSDKISYYSGEPIKFYLSSPVRQTKQLKVYNVNKDKEVFSISADIMPQKINNKKPWVNGFGYDETISTVLPHGLKPGLYYLNGNIPFICKGSGTTHDITVVYPSNTLNAYNWMGGKSLYHPDHANRSTVVSFLRPLLRTPQEYAGLGFLKWMENQSYDVNYICDEDLDQYEEIQHSKMVIIIGHSEYWTGKARENINKFIGAGRNVLILSGNTMWWQVRYNHDKHVMICYKDAHLDPIQDPALKTINWYWTELKSSIIESIGADFRFGGYGDQIPGRNNGYKITNDGSPILENTGLHNGDILSLPTHEYDGAPLMKNILPGSPDIPVIDNSVLNCYKSELLGYDFASDGHLKGVGTFIVFQKSQHSGTVVNVSSMNWCFEGNFNGSNNSRIPKMTKNMIDKTLSHSSLFSKSLASSVLRQ